jgi:hypothetical protein
VTAVLTVATPSWFAVRCLFEWSGLGSMKRRVYEERITLWRAPDFDEAIERAETEAGEYIGRENNREEV